MWGRGPDGGACPGTPTHAFISVRVGWPPSPVVAQAAQQLWPKGVEWSQLITRLLTHPLVHLPLTLPSSLVREVLSLLCPKEVERRGGGKPGVLELPPPPRSMLRAVPVGEGDESRPAAPPPWPRWGQLSGIQAAGHFPAIAAPSELATMQ